MKKIEIPHRFSLSDVLAGPDNSIRATVQLRVEWIEIEFTIGPRRRTIDDSWEQSQWEAK